MTIFTEELFARARLLKETNMDMERVAAILGVNKHSLITMACRRGVKLGRPYRRRDKSVKEAEYGIHQSIRLKADPLLERLNAGYR